MFVVSDFSGDKMPRLNYSLRKDQSKGYLYITEKRDKSDKIRLISFAFERQKEVIDKTTEVDWNWIENVDYVNDAFSREIYNQTYNVSQIDRKCSNIKPGDKNIITKAGREETTYAFANKSKLKKYCTWFKNVYVFGSRIALGQYDHILLGSESYKYKPMITVYLIDGVYMASMFWWIQETTTFLTFPNISYSSYLTYGISKEKEKRLMIELIKECAERSIELGAKHIKVLKQGGKFNHVFKKENGFTTERITSKEVFDGTIESKRINSPTSMVVIYDYKYDF